MHDNHVTPQPAPLSIGALSERTGCKVETIRYYEHIGLLPAPPRTPGGHRLYPQGQRERLSFIRRSRELGFSLEEVRELLALVDSGDYSCAQIQTMTLRHLEEVRRKIADLRRLEQTLKEMAATCEAGEIPQCPIIETLSK